MPGPGHYDPKKKKTAQIIDEMEINKVPTLGG